MYHQDRNEVCDLKLIDFQEDSPNIEKISFEPYMFDGEVEFPEQLLKVSNFDFLVKNIKQVFVQGIQVQKSSNQLVTMLSEFAQIVTYQYIVYLDNNLVFVKQITTSEIQLMQHMEFKQNEMEAQYCITQQVGSKKSVMYDILYEENYKVTGQWYGNAMVDSVEDSLVKNIRFIKNTGYEQLTLCYQGITKGVIDNLLMEGNEGWKEMSLIRNNGSIEIKNSLIKNNILDTTALIQLSNIDLVNVHDTIFENNSQDVSLGKLQILLVLTRGYIFKDLIFRHNYIQGIGGCIYISESSNGLMENIKFYDNTATKSGTAVYAVMGSVLEVINCEFTDNNPTISEQDSFGAEGIFYANRYSGIKFLIKNIFTGNKGIISSSIFLSECNDFYIENGLFQNNVYFSGVNGLTIQSSKNITIKNSDFLDSNMPDKYGALNIYDGNEDILIENCIFQNIHVQSLIGVIYVFRATNITIKNSQFINNSANIVGVMQIEKSQIINIIDCIFKKNQANSQIGGVKIMDSSYISILNTDFIENYAGKSIGALSIYQCHTFSMTNVDMNINKVGYTTGAMEIYFSDGEIILNKINFNENFAEKETGGALGLIENSSAVTILNSIFINNFAGLQGGAIIMERQQATILNNIKFNLNQALIQGGAIQSSKSVSLIVINCQFDQNYSEEQASAIYLNQVDILQLKQNTSFQNHYSSEKGGVIYGKILQSVDIVDSNFENNGALMEGGVFIIEQCGILKIENSLFQNNQAFIQGGVGKFQDIQDFQITKNTQIVNNKIENFERIKVDEKNNNDYNVILNSFEIEILKFQQVGGAMQIQNCQKLLMQDIIVSENQANYMGGAFFMSNIFSLQILKSNFTNNIVKFDKYLELTQKDQNYLLTQGGAIYLEQINNDLEYRLIMIIDSIFSKNEASSGGSLLLYNSEATLQTLYVQQIECLHNIADHGPCIRYIGPQRQNITDEIQSINTSNMINTALISNGQHNIYQFQPNERQNSETDYRISLCPPGTYLEEGGELICQQCVENGVCSGGYIPTYPAEEYWRENEDSFDFIYCNMNPKACLGNDICKEGYIGVKCENCDSLNHYAQSDSINCSKCSATEWVILKFLILFFIIILAIANQIYGSIHRAEKQHTIKNIRILIKYPIKNTTITTGLVSLIIMHCQILNLVSSITLQMPTFLTSALSIFGNPSQVLSTSITCLNKIKGLEELVKEQQNLSLYGLLLLVGALFIIILFLFIRYFRPSKLKKLEYRKKIFSFFVSAVICFLILIQPGMLFNSANFVSCKKIGEQSYNVADSNLKCSDPFFKNEVLPINISILVGIGFLFPVFIIYNLWKGKKTNQLDSIFFTRKYALLFINSKQKYYYWDFLLLMQKIIIVLIATLLQEQALLKGVLIIFIIQVYLQVSNKLKPFTSIELNTYYNYLCYIQILTIIGSIIIEQQSSLYSDNETTSDVVKICCLIVIIAVNGIFFLIAGKVLVRETIHNYQFFIIKHFPNFAKKSKILKNHQLKMKAIQYWMKLQKGIRGNYPQFWELQDEIKQDLTHTNPTIYNDQSASNYFRMKHSGYQADYDNYTQSLYQKENKSLYKETNALSVNNPRGKNNTNLSTQYTKNNKKRLNSCSESVQYLDLHTTNRNSMQVQIHQLPQQQQQISQSNSVASTTRGLNYRQLKRRSDDIQSYRKTSHQIHNNHKNVNNNNKKKKPNSHNNFNMQNYNKANSTYTNSNNTGNQKSQELQNMDSMSQYQQESMFRLNNQSNQNNQQRFDDQILEHKMDVTYPAFSVQNNSNTNYLQKDSNYLVNFEVEFDNIDFLEEPSIAAVKQSQRTEKNNE